MVPAPAKAGQTKSPPTPSLNPAVAGRAKEGKTPAAEGQSPAVAGQAPAKAGQDG